jgi:putative phosphoribosyl transferase
MPRPPFRDRADAGVALARTVAPVLARRDVVVLGLARGGVAVARPVADALGAPLDVIVARKLGVPGVEEVAIGAVAEGSARVFGDDVAWLLGAPPEVVARIAERERREVARRVRAYRDGRPLPEVRGRTVVLVDDGLATGATLRAAAHALRARRPPPARLVAAVPVTSAAGAHDVADAVDGVIAVVTVESLGTVSAWYDDFVPLGDDDVRRLLGREPFAPCAPRAPDDAPAEHTVAIPTPGGPVAADLGVPDEACGLVVLAHGGGSSRNGYRNRYLAGRLRLAGFATLRVDLLTAEEQAADRACASLRFDVARLARRLGAACAWSAREGLPGADHVGLVGASTGAAAALVTAARRPASVAAVVSRGGRVDLAGDALALVRAPALLVVGGADGDTLRRNRAAVRRLAGPARLAVVRGAGHAFEEPGALGAAAEHAVRWLDRHAAARPADRTRGWWRRLVSSGR